ncbi:transglycosylase SLT domain-containing protein [candidate division KSB1 bacterium]|nr:transglycosylase SLT domain-containing protein [candidate division KSB1 bacterium]
MTYAMTEKIKHKTATPFNAPTIAVRIERGESNATEFVFRQSFRIGRDETCQVQFKDYIVSRVHAEVTFEQGQWWVSDLRSSNGVYRDDGEKVERAPLLDETRLMLGQEGPALVLTPELKHAAAVTRVSEPSMTRYIQRYFDDKITEGVSEHTMMMRQAFRQVRKKQTRVYGIALGLISVLLLGVGVYAVYQERQIRKQQALARDIFYEMKSLELLLAQLEKAVMQSGNTQMLSEVSKYRAKRDELEKNYDHFVDELGIYSKRMPEDERMILRMARLWGECEVDLPKDFVTEVRRFISMWKSTGRLENAIKRAYERGYVPKIAEAMLAHHMPPRFLYLALQESNFDATKCGPMTKHGYAKGMWQFIPETAKKYGLRTGPLVELQRYDPRDERHDFIKSTEAAARYLRDIYDTDAQASGLLVIASYNWGENKVIDLIRKMPENPRERNFWRLLKNYRERLPDETYNYVFYIFSAAVIGENPRIFGFKFDNPLTPIL